MFWFWCSNSTHIDQNIRGSHPKGPKFRKIQQLHLLFNVFWKSRSKTSENHLHFKVVQCYGMTYAVKQQVLWWVACFALLCFCFAWFSLICSDVLCLLWYKIVFSIWFALHCFFVLVLLALLCSNMICFALLCFVCTSLPWFDLIVVICIHLFALFCMDFA